MGIFYILSWVHIPPITPNPNPISPSLSGNGFLTSVSACFSLLLSNSSMFWMVLSWFSTVNRYIQHICSHSFTMQITTDTLRSKPDRLESLTNTSRSASLIWNRVGQAGSCRHCGGHSSVGVVDRSTSVIRGFVHLLLQQFDTLLSAGFKSGEIGGHGYSGINFGVSFSENSLAARTQWAIHVSQGIVWTDFSGEVGNVNTILLQIYPWNHTLNFIGIARVLLEILRKNVWSHFPGHSVQWNNVTPMPSAWFSWRQQP